MSVSADRSSAELHLQPRTVTVCADALLLLVATQFILGSAASQYAQVVENGWSEIVACTIGSAASSSGRSLSSSPQSKSDACSLQHLLARSERSKLPLLWALLLRLAAFELRRVAVDAHAQVLTMAPQPSVLPSSTSAASSSSASSAALASEYEASTVATPPWMRKIDQILTIVLCAWRVPALVAAAQDASSPPSKSSSSPPSSLSAVPLHPPAGLYPSTAHLVATQSFFAGFANAVAAVSPRVAALWIQRATKTAQISLLHNGPSYRCDQSAALFALLGLALDISLPPPTNQNTRSSSSPPPSSPPSASPSAAAASSAATYAKAKGVSEPQQQQQQPVIKYRRVPTLALRELLMCSLSAPEVHFVVFCYVSRVFYSNSYCLPS
jgi:hypothetical protein